MARGILRLRVYAPCARCSWFQYVVAARRLCSQSRHTTLDGGLRDLEHPSAHLEQPLRRREHHARMPMSREQNPQFSLPEWM